MIIDKADLRYACIEPEHPRRLTHIAALGKDGSPRLMWSLCRGTILAHEHSPYLKEGERLCPRCQTTHSLAQEFTGRWFSSTIVDGRGRVKEVEVPTP